MVILITPRPSCKQLHHSSMKSLQTWMLFSRQTSISCLVDTGLTLQRPWQLTHRSERCTSTMPVFRSLCGDQTRISKTTPTRCGEGLSRVTTNNAGSFLSPSFLIQFREKCHSTKRSLMLRCLTRKLSGLLVMNRILTNPLATL